MKAIRDKIKKLRYPYYVYREIMKKKEEKKRIVEGCGQTI